MILSETLGKGYKLFGYEKKQKKHIKYRKNLQIQILAYNMLLRLLMAELTSFAEMFLKDKNKIYPVEYLI